jgi:hypothetical protein
MFSAITNIFNKKTKGSTLMELFTSTEKLKKFFLTTRDVRWVHYGWHGTHRHDIHVLATHAWTWVYRYSSLLQWSMPLGQRGHVALPRDLASTDHCSNEEYRCIRVDECVLRTWILCRCAPCHPWCTHRTSLFVKLFSFPVAVKSSIKVGHLVFLL